MSTVDYTTQASKPQTFIRGEIMAEGQSRAVSVPIKKEKRERIYIIDEVRGFAVICMVFYHTLYSLGFVFGSSLAVKIFNIFTPVEPAFAALFIFISGICTRLSRSNLKRGLMLLLIALMVNILTAVILPDFIIAFGILNLLSVCMIVYGLFGRQILKIPCKLGLALSVLIFAVTYGVRWGYLGLFKYPLVKLPQVLYSTRFLFPLGLRGEEFFSTDYFPIFPWLFAFVGGAFFAEIFSQKNISQKLYEKHSTLLCYIGKHSLTVYLVHQPLIFAAAYLFNIFMTA